MRLPTTEHTRRPWRTVEDVWALRAPGAGIDDFVQFREAIAETGDPRNPPPPVLVRPNGQLGRLYLQLIEPIRYAVAYPVMTRRWERLWRDTVFGGRA